jgi:heptaprenyl diphosphate synthase
MPSPNERVVRLNRKRIHLALLAAIASILFAVEETVALPIPIFRLGLANTVTLLVIYWFGTKEALAVTVIRVAVGSLLIGRLFQPSFLFSLAGGAGSAVVMGAAVQWSGRIFSAVGVSIIGALVKNFIQLAVAGWFVIGSLRLFSLLPLFLWISIASGAVTGVATLVLLYRLPRPGSETAAAPPSQNL